MNKSRVIDALNGVRMQDGNLGLDTLSKTIEKQADGIEKSKLELMSYMKDELDKVRKYMLNFKNDASKKDEIEECKNFISRMNKVYDKLSR